MFKIKQKVFGLFAGAMILVYLISAMHTHAIGLEHESLGLVYFDGAGQGDERASLRTTMPIVMRMDDDEQYDVVCDRRLERICCKTCVNALSVGGMCSVGCVGCMCCGMFALSSSILAATQNKLGASETAVLFCCSVGSGICLLEMPKVCRFFKKGIRNCLSHRINRLKEVCVESAINLHKQD